MGLNFCRLVRSSKSTPVGLNPFCFPPERLRPLLFQLTLLHLRNHHPTRIHQTRSLLDPRSPAWLLLADAEQRIAKRPVKLSHKSMPAQKHPLSTSINKITWTKSRSTSRGQDCTEPSHAALNLHIAHWTSPDKPAGETVHKNNQSFKIHQGSM